MRQRRDMLRHFIAESYAEQSITAIVGDLRAHLPDADVVALTRAALVPVVLPDLVEAIETVVLGADKRPHLRGYAGGLISYVYNPLDIIQAEGVVGWIDDTVIAAMGLLKLGETEAVELDPVIRASCELAAATLPELGAPVRGAIEELVEALWAKTA